jgi:(2Fe-2S) ferredoxin
VLQVCRTLSCALNGAERVTEALSEKLGIGVGETDASGMFTLLEFECLGACDRAPVVMVNNEHWHEQATPESCSKLVDDLTSGPAALTGCHLGVESMANGNARGTVGSVRERPCDRTHTHGTNPHQIRRKSPTATRSTST